MQPFSTSGAGTKGGGPCDGCVGELGIVADSEGAEDAGLDGGTLLDGETGGVFEVPGAEDDGEVEPGCCGDSGVVPVAGTVLVSTHLVQTV